MPTLLNKGALSYPDLPDVYPDEYIYNFIKSRLQKPLSENPFLDRILILEAKTASGKSVTIPPLCTAILADLGPPFSNKKVLCTQPRVLTATTIPKEIDGVDWFKKYNNLVFKFDDNLAYHTGPFQNVTPSAKLIYSSDGVLDVQLTKNPPSYVMNKYGFIIIDEAHDRSLRFDKNLMMLKHIFLENSTNRDLPFIICMSATFDYVKYANFFNCGMENVIRVAGASFPIEVRWPTSDIAQYIPEAVVKIRECIDEELRNEFKLLANKAEKTPKIDSSNRILVFLPGQGETKKVIKGLMKLDENTSTLIRTTKNDDIETVDYYYKIDNMVVELNIEILPFDGQAVGRSSKAYLRVTGNNEPKKQNIDMIFSIQIMITGAVAETGLSLPDLQYVIDAGWNKTSEFNPRVNIAKVLITKPCAQSQATQRKGRVGRKKSGVCIPLYTEESFNMLQELQEPEIIREDPTMMLLAYASLYGGLEVGEIVGKSKISERLLDSPSVSSNELAIRKLQTLGFMDNNGNVTESGKIASKITSLNVQQIGMILAGIVWDVCLDDLVAIAVITPELVGPGAIWGYNQIEKQKLEKIANDKSNKNAMFEAKEKLRIRLPNLDNWNEILSVVFPTTDKKDLYYKYRLICCDEFLDGLIIYRAFQIKFSEYKMIALSQNKDNSWVVSELIKWSSKAFITYPKFIKLIDSYGKTLDDLVTAGINVFKNKDLSLVRLPLVAEPPFTDTLSKIKKCIQHGYKFNTATLDPINHKYNVWWSKLDEKIEIDKQFPKEKMREGNQIQFSWTMFGDGIGNWKKMQAAYEYMPKTIIFRELDISMYDPKTEAYPLACHHVSVVSGF
jgi:HrpA-like RNA helicase